MVNEVNFKVSSVWSNNNLKELEMQEKLFFYKFNSQKLFQDETYKNMNTSRML